MSSLPIFKERALNKDTNTRRQGSLDAHVARSCGQFEKNLEYGGKSPARKSSPEKCLLLGVGQLRPSFKRLKVSILG